MTRHPDRPRYRVLATPRYDHDPGDPLRHPDGANHGTPGSASCCAAGHALELHRVDDLWLAGRAGGAYAREPLTTDLRVAGPQLDPAEARAATVAWVREHSVPFLTQTVPADVEVYLRVTPAADPADDREEPCST